MRARTIALVLSSLWVGSARAETLTWRVEDPALRRKTQLVYVEKVDAPPAPERAPLSMTQRGNVYLPHILPVVVGSQVIFKSEDPELHNVYARGEKRVLFNDAVLPKMQSTAKTFADLGVVHLTCNIHKEMSAYVVVLQNPFFAMPQKDGTVTISGLPRGHYLLRIWGEDLSEADRGNTFAVSVGGAS